MEQFSLICGIVSVILLTMALIIAIVRYSALTQNEKWYSYYIIFIFFIELMSYVGFPLLKITSNAFFYPVYIAGEFFTITGIFIKKLNFGKKSFILTGLLSLFFLTADRLLVNYQYNNDYSKAISNVIIVSFIGYSLIQEIKKVKSRFQIIDKMFFLYFTVSIFIFMLQHQLVELPLEYFSAVWVINNLMVCIVYALFIKTFLQLKK